MPSTNVKIKVSVEFWLEAENEKDAAIKCWEAVQQCIDSKLMYVCVGHFDDQQSYMVRVGDSGLEALDKVEQANLIMQEYLKQGNI